MSVELPESVINGRFKYSERPMASPGKCAVCGAVDKPVIDFGMDLDFYGAVLMCTECIRGAAEVAGLYEGAATATAQVVPPFHYLDVGALNEYLARTNVATTALNSILADYVGHRQMDDESAEEYSTIHGKATAGPDSVDESSTTVSLSEGPISVPASSGDQFDIFRDI